jgi:glutaconate CoA-transferase subunit A
MADKRSTIDDIVAELRDGMVIGIGGWSTRRKPMALVRAIARSPLRDLTIVSYGGPDVGMLAASGKIARLIFAFVSLDHIPLDPHFRAARQAGLRVWELDEGLLHWGLRAAAMRLPFLPSRVGLGTDIAHQPEFRTLVSPYDDAETLLAMPAIPLDAALLHVHRADPAGNTLTLSPDPFFDELMARAARRVYVTTEQLVSTEALNMRENARYNLFERALVKRVAVAPFGAHPTSAAPDYQLDMSHLKTYVEAAADWPAYRARFVDVSDADYLAAIGGADKINTLPMVVY